MSALNRRSFLTLTLQTGCVLAWPDVVLGKKPPPDMKTGGDLKVITTPIYPDLPKGALKRLGTSTLRVPSGISAVRFSQNSDVLLAAESDELRGWHPATGKLLFRFSYPQGISSQAGILNTKGGLTVLGRPDGGGKYELHQYSLKDGKLLNRSQQIGIDTNDHTDFTLDGSLLALLHGHQLHVYDAFTGAEKWTATLPNEAVGGCRFFPDGKTLAVAKKGEIRLYNAADGKELPPLKLGEFKHEDKNGWDWLTQPLISRDGAWLAAMVGEDEAGVGLWDLKTKKFLRLVTPATSVEGFVLDGPLVVTGVVGRFTFWNIATGASVRTVSVPSGSEVHLSPDGQWLASEAVDAVILYDATTGQMLPHSADPPGRPSQMWFTSPTQLVGQLPEYGGWVQWDITTGKEQLLRAKDVDGCRSLTLSADGRVGLHAKKDLYIVQELRTGKTLVTHTIPANEARSRRGEAINAALSPDGKHLVFSAGTGLEVITVAEGQRTTVPHKAADAPLEGVIIRIAGPVVAVATTREETNFIDIYDLPQKRWRQRIGVPGEILHTSLSADGRLVSVAYYQNDEERGQTLATAVYPTSGGSALYHVTEKNHSEPALALSPDGRVLARAEQDDKVNIYEVGVGLRQTLATGTTPSALAIAPDGHLLATSQHGGPVVLWELYPKSPAPTPDRKTLDGIWKGLTADNAQRVHGDLCVLIQNPKETLPFLRTMLPPVAGTDVNAIRKHLSELDHPQYRRRESATKALQDLGDLAIPFVREALGQNPEPEARERMEKLLRLETKVSPEQRRILRVVEVVERMATPDAVALLTSWSQGAPGALLTREASAAKQRLGR